MLKILKKQYRRFKMPIVTRMIEREKSPYMVLVSTMISLRTKDDVTEEAAERLFERADSPADMLNLSKEEIEELIYPAGFYRNKAKAILKTSRILINRYNGEVPDNIDDLLGLPGVGRKTANLVLALSFEKDAICVDTHVHRISNRLGLVDTDNPEETEYALMDVLPKEWWRIYNDMLVTWGQNICTPVSPFCSKCSIKKYCPKIGVEKSR
ncbi:MAG: endonuclease III [bacterium]